MIFLFKGIQYFSGSIDTFFVSRGVDVPSYVSRHQRASSGKLWKHPPTKAMFVRVSEVWKIHHWKRHFLMENVE